MRKLRSTTFVSLDGVAQAPGGPEGDPRGGFALGGWTVPFFDGHVGEVMGRFIHGAAVRPRSRAAHL